MKRTDVGGEEACGGENNKDDYIEEGEVTQCIPQSQPHLFPPTINYQSQKLALDSLPEEQVACRPI